MTASLSLEQIALEVAFDLDDGWYVNLGIGLPSLVASHLPPDREVVIHCENGMLGMGPRAGPGQEDSNLLDAGKTPVTLVNGGSYFSHADSFAMIRGGHLDACVLGAYQVSAQGDLANWSLGDNIPAVGGAMDLAVGSRRVYVMMTHTSKRGESKMVVRTTAPVTATSVVTRIYTELGIFVPMGERFMAVALATGVEPHEVAARTACPLFLSASCISLPR